MEITIQVPEWSVDVFNPDAVNGMLVRYRVAKGGRGSSKSWEFARRLLRLSISKPLTILCTRELQKSIKDSVHRLLISQIEIMGLQANFEWDKTHLTSNIGSEFLFYGLRYNTDEIKSMEGIDICWLEEAQGTKQESLDMLIPTIRKPNSEIWVTYNPKNEDDPIHNMFAVEGRKDAIVRHVNFDENPWFPEVLRVEKDRLKKVNRRLYERVWEGKIVDIGAGDYYPSEKAIIIDDAPDNITSKVRAWDLAATEPSARNPNPDYTSGVLMGITKGGDIVILDVVSKQINANDVRRLISNTAMMDGKDVKIRIPQDPAQAGKEQAESYVRMLSLFKVITKRVTGSKEKRAEPLSSEWHGGNVYVVNSGWTSDYFKIMNAFPYGDHDDTVDASNDAYSELKETHNRASNLSRSLYKVYGG